MGNHGVPRNGIFGSGRSGAHRASQPSRHPYLQPQKPAGTSYTSAERNPYMGEPQPRVAQQDAEDLTATVRIPKIPLAAILEEPRPQAQDHRYNKLVDYTGFRPNPEWSGMHNAAAQETLRQSGLQSLDQVVLPGAENQHAPIDSYVYQHDNGVERPKHAIEPHRNEVGLKYGFLANPDYVKYHNKNRQMGEPWLDEGMVIDQRVQTYVDPAAPQSNGGFTLPIEWV